MGFNFFESIAKRKQEIAYLEAQSRKTMQDLEVFFNEQMQNYKQMVQTETEQMHKLDVQQISDFNKLFEDYNSKVQTLAAERTKKFDDVIANYTVQMEQLSQEIKDLQENKIKIIQQTQEESNKLREEILAKTDERIQEEFNILRQKQDEFAKLQVEYKNLKQAFELEQQQFTADKKRLEEYATQLAKERENIDNTVTDKIAIERENLVNYENELRDKEASIKETVEKETQFERERLEDFKTKLEDREARFEEIVEEKTEERVRDRQDEMEKALAQAKEDIKYFSEKAQGYEKLEQFYQEMHNSIGEDPASVMKQLAEKNETIRQLREELINRPTKEMEEKYNALEAKREKITEIYEKVKSKEEDQKITSTENAKLKSQIEPMKTQIHSLEKELNYYRGIHQTESSREKRIEVIETPLKKFSNIIIDESGSITTEEKWLEEIDDGIKKYGLTFPKRILYAFHTALKCGEISPLTVLAGVSGTGKSELPRLYSHFGGLNFLSLPVQPNWDSQESMLGYFNSIENTFDAQEVLRLLVQTQHDEKLKQVPTLILLDEMNLANVELYFSDFLSKLETRRGLSDDNLPTIGVKLGSGLEDYQVPLGRNVLWAGTMNQDETTKTLSDKVLDRGIVINFPSPDTLISRNIKKKLGDKRALLKLSTWNSWIQNSMPEAISGNMKKYKETIEEINKIIGKAGRAIGQRVWQSIETYINNYPSVISNLSNEAVLNKELNKAFSDQLVQKIMPKLRGLEVEGSQGDCLKEVQAKISDYGLDEDFKNAMELGYGQFMWNTSKYALDSNNVSEDVHKNTSEDLGQRYTDNEVSDTEK